MVVTLRQIDPAPKPVLLWSTYIHLFELDIRAHCISSRGKVPEQIVVTKLRARNVKDVIRRMKQATNYVTHMDIL
jgi:hypothetical protein